MVYPALLPLMRTPRLPAVDWTDALADLNGLARFAETRNLVSARVQSHCNWSLHVNLFCAKIFELTTQFCVKGTYPHEDYNEQCHPWDFIQIFRILFTRTNTNMIYKVIQNDCRGTIVQRQFRTKLGKQPPSDNSIRRWYAQFQETGCVCIPELKVWIRTATETITADMLQTVWNTTRLSYWHL